MEAGVAGDLPAADLASPIGDSLSRCRLVVRLFARPSPKDVHRRVVIGKDFALGLVARPGFQAVDDLDEVEVELQGILDPSGTFEEAILGETKLDLSKFDLDEGTNISYAVRVTDNRMLNLDPKEVASARSE